jgi:hypothetical protein
VDFFFYSGSDTENNAKFHVRRENPKPDQSAPSFDIHLTAETMNALFPDGIDQITVFVVANWPSSFGDNLSGTTLANLRAKAASTDFPATESDTYRQTPFPMSGIAQIQRTPATEKIAEETIQMTRFASKITVSVHAAKYVTLKPDPNDIDGNTWEEWQPLMNQMEIYLVNGVKTVSVSGEKSPLGEEDFFSYRSRPRKFLDKDNTPLVGQDEWKGLTYYNTYPMYTYPQRWQAGSPEEPYLKLVLPWQRMPKYGKTSTQKQYYYKIMIPRDARGGDYWDRFVRNNWYQYYIDVAILGSDVDDGSVSINSMDMFVVPWQEQNFVQQHAQIGTARYLSVARDTLRLNNVSSRVTIPFVSSQEIAIIDINATRPYYGDVETGETLGGTVCVAGKDDIYPEGTKYLSFNDVQRRTQQGKRSQSTMSDNWDWITQEGSSLIFEHLLENDYTKEDFDYSPYRVSFTIKHADQPNDTQYSKQIIIFQYPAIYIEAKLKRTKAKAFINKGSDKDVNKYTSETWGDVIVDGDRNRYRPCTKTEDGWDLYYATELKDEVLKKRSLQWHTVYYTGGSQNLYKINVTVLPTDSDFVIGDPRRDDEDNLNLGTVWYEINRHAPDSDGKGAVGELAETTGYAQARTVSLNNNKTEFIISPEMRTLQHYYPTEATERTKMMLAPSYLISSKFSGIEYGPISIEDARYRCASLQEDGYPAGRWRIPTYGEIAFISRLSVNHAFTFLFNEGATYWSANGAVLVSADGSNLINSSTAYLRCVYDVWYWGDIQLQENDRGIFVWGDQER